MQPQPPGWYPTPDGRHAYWDGQQWLPIPPQPRRRAVNLGLWWAAGIVGGIVSFLLGGVFLWVPFVLFWSVGYAGTAAGLRTANQRVARGLPERRWQGIGPKLDDNQKPSWW